ncbi:hypothetical protein M9458_045746, partial [Cirrhinus mrigala]
LFRCWVTTACPVWMTVINYRTRTLLFMRFSAVPTSHPLAPFMKRLSLQNYEDTTFP